MSLCLSFEFDTSHVATEARSATASCCGPSCSYSSCNGKCCSANWNDEDKGEDDDWNGDDWVGMEPVRIVDGLAVGLLLDLDAGTLSVFKDGRKLGVMKEGLTGAYCWFVYSPISTRGAFCINVKRGMPPENE